MDILVELGRAESIAHLESPPGCPPGQKGPCPTEPKPECDDGIDNDGDGKIDMEDPDCDSPTDSETPECSDKADNDGDGKIDADDPGCLDNEGKYNPADDDESDEKNGDGGLAATGADVAPLLAGAFLLIGLGALTVAATRRRVGKHTV